VQGFQGDTGQPGPQGFQGVPGTATEITSYTVSNTVPPTGGNTFADVFCNPGDTATGGGGDANGSLGVGTRPIPPGPNPTGWQAQSSIGPQGAVTVWAVCQHVTTV